MTLTFDLLTPKSIGHILNSWGASVCSFMIIGGLQSQLSSGNHFQKNSVTDRRTDGQTDRQTECKPIVPSGFTGGGLITMRHDLDL